MTVIAIALTFQVVYVMNYVRLLISLSLPIHSMFPVGVE
ncbi:hypothetical protein RintRC_6455 [Richelia intracellularis]|nr:hypothetical protein RintRC_6455 [Richelia intracellularis]